MKSNNSFSLAAGIIAAIFVGQAIASPLADSDNNDGIDDWSWTSDVFAPSVTSASARGGEFCNRKPTFSNPCGGCEGWGVHKQRGPDCPGCGIFCTTIEPILPDKASSADEALVDYDIPFDAIYTEVSVTADCSTAENVGETRQVVVWNPASVLDEFNPYAVAVDSTTISELAVKHPAAAYFLGLRLESDGLVVAAPDMHQAGRSTSDGVFTPEFALRSIDLPADQPLPELESLSAGQEFHYQFESDFEHRKAPVLRIKSWVSDANSLTVLEHQETTVFLEQSPSRMSPVVASGGYLAPVYRVKGFDIR